MNELVKGSKKYSSLYLVEQINIFRKEENVKAVLLHKNILAKIESEFDEEINELNILPVEYKDKKGEKRKCYELEYKYALQILISESKAVRRSVIKKIEKFEGSINNGLLLSHNEVISLLDMVMASYLLEFRQSARKKHLSSYIPEAPKPKDYSAAQLERNNVCGIDKIELEKRLNTQNIRYKTVEKCLIKIDKFELIRISVIDCMMHFGKSKEYAVNIGNFAKELAEKRTDLSFTRINTMFSVPESISKTMELLNNY